MPANAPVNPTEQDVMGAAVKSIEDAAKSLGVLFTHVSTSDPSGESSEVVSEMLRGLGSLKTRIYEGPPPPPDPAMMGGPPPPEPMIQNAPPMEQAGMDAFAQMNPGGPQLPEGY